MNTDNLNDLPAWDTVYPPFIEADKNGTERPTDETCEVAQELYAKWSEILYMIRGSFDIQDADFKMAEFEGDIDEIVGMNVEETERNRRVYWIRLKVQIIIESYEVGKHILEAEFRGSYIQRMEKAVFIRKIVISIDTLLETLMSEEGIDIDPSYIEMIRGEIVLFRYLFKKWVSTFKIDVDNMDEWGLFI